MRVCVALSETLAISVDVDELGTVEDIKVLIQVQTGIPNEQQKLVHNGNTLNNSTAILESGLLENDIINLLAPISQVKLEALHLIQSTTNNPSELRAIEHGNPELGKVLRTGDIFDVEKFLTDFLEKQQKLKQEKLREEMNLDLDPLNPNNQKEIESRIQQKNINANLEYAQEFTPEVFASVTMLYIDLKVNGRGIQAFVDSGAQNTIMSKKCAEKLEIMRLVDTRFHGFAQGVGTDKILGRIHAINLEIGGKFFNCSFHILENSKIDMLFGLDMLKRHQCCIDLHLNRLTLNAGEISIPFLSEGEMEKKEDEILTEENEEKMIEEKIEEKKVEEKKVEAKSQPKDENRNSLWEDKVTKIVKLGYSRADAEQALKMFQGNEDMAASYLFTKNDPFGF